MYYRCGWDCGPGDLQMLLGWWLCGASISLYVLGNIYLEGLYFQEICNEDSRVAPYTRSLNHKIRCKNPRIRFLFRGNGIIYRVELSEVGKREEKDIEYTNRQYFGLNIRTRQHYLFTRGFRLICFGSIFRG